ncbi:MAG TPA: crossover junction endodeoxyribonuclease RuvC [Bacillota bacterium]|nr:crossover junction endodeoxyribonuclease RuvC [Bacillota bacterium]HOJ58629.1 crossover junction endodeoxyribonuclease RuvC [Bacillota bacterium]HOL02968.1 crossover junction endodeoxyribonuclease RuvC [Bacillota bacterium]HPO81310.1 crossover junction endodeoxyribonuclease RuvC [Bacillota bacterium]HPU62378.1 crossover junction endodeoxyribonuclease RuvC [Bacillota bacterium]
MPHGASNEQGFTGLRLMGVDPGLIDTGYGIIDILGNKIRLVEAGLVRTTKGASLESRLKEIYKGIASVIEEHRPSAVVVEDLYTNYRYPRTAVLMGHARGVILLAANSNGLSVTAYPPARVKKALTGTGRATKIQIQRMVQVRLGLDKVPEPDHIADALALALCHYDYLTHGLDLKAKDGGRRT